MKIVEKKLKGLISQGESVTLEFKESTSAWKEIINTVSGFANTRGGKIAIGIAKGRKLIGLDVGQGTIEDICNKIVQNTDPKIYPNISLEKVDGKSIIIIEVRESADHLVLAFGRPYKRVGRSTVRMSKDEYERQILEKHKNNHRFDTAVCLKATLKDIDERRLIWFLKRAKEDRNYDIDPGIAVREVLERLNLIDRGEINNTAVLLFAKNLQRFFPQVKIRAGRIKGVAGLDFIDMKILLGTVPELREKAMKFIMEHIKHGVFFDADRRYDRWEYPLRAVEEVLNNALAHRDYFSNAEIQLSIYDDRIEIWNPGELPRPLTPADLKRKHKSIPRNKLLADKLFLIKFIEQWGKGTNRIINEMEKNNLPEPIFKNLSGGFEVTLFGPGKSFEEEIEREKLHKLQINERQEKAIAYLKTNNIISTKIYMKLNKVSDKTAFLELKDLLAKNILTREGKGRATVYRLKR